MLKLNSNTIFIILFISIVFSCDDGYTLLKNGDELKVTQYSYSDTYNFISVPIPSGGIVFPVGYDDNNTAFIGNSYLIGDSEVIIGLWYTVAYWATYVKEDEKYRNIFFNGHNYFENEAMSYPINDVTYIQVIIWCNAYTEWYNYKFGTNLIPVYTDKAGKPLRTAMLPLNPRFAGLYPNKYLEIFVDYINTYEDILYYFENKETTGNGFRLPTHHEWELAARWNGTNSINTVTDIVNGINFSEHEIKFLKGNSASGAKDSISNLYETHKYGYFRENSNLAVHLPKKKLPNALGLYDMSGNLAEFVYEVEYINLQGVVDVPFAITKGGNFMFTYTDPILDNVESLAVGRKVLVDVTAYNYPYGFRIARNEE